jgi:hypothetical protein
MYVSCIHEGRSIAGEVEVALAAEVHATNSEVEMKEAVAKRVSVIEVRFTRGAGKDASDAMRQVVRYYNDDGQLLAEADPAPWFTDPSVSHSRS